MSKTICYFKRIATVFAVVLTLSYAAPIKAIDVGEIALVEDATGKMLPLAGMCDNPAYTNGLCVTHAGIAFFATHPDEYDMLVFFSAKAINPMFDPKQALRLAASAKGLGADTTPWTSSALGSGGRLIHAVAMGSLISLPDDPNDIYKSDIPLPGLTVLAHEIGHHWLAFTMLNKNDEYGQQDILRGYFNDSVTSHWSCWSNTGQDTVMPDGTTKFCGSVMHGGMLKDNGDGTYTDINGPRKFSQLDQYFMGLRLAAEVQMPLWYVRVGYDLHGCADMPLAEGVPKTFEGERLEYTVDDIIRANGERIPKASPCHFKIGFILVHGSGVPPTLEQIQKVDRYRTALEAWWPWATDYYGSLDTTLSGCGVGTLACEGKQSKHCFAADGDDDAAEIIENEIVEIELPCAKDEIKCDGALAIYCDSYGQWIMRENCADSGGSCLEGGCVAADGDEETAEEPAAEGEHAAEETGETVNEEEDSSLTDSEFGDQSKKNGSSGDGCAAEGFSAAAFAVIAAALILRRRRD